MTKVTETWHSVVGWTTLDQIVNARLYKTGRGRDDCAKPMFVIFEYESLKTDLEAVRNKKKVLEGK